MEIDLLLFARKLAQPFQIKKRFIGTEPNCLTTRYYSEIMLRVLQQEGVETVQLERKAISNRAISASRVRELIKQEAFDELHDLVPDTTLNYLISDEAHVIRQRMKTYQRRH
jgi:[citrate (pro-3S)-lyase] ligase